MNLNGALTLELLELLQQHKLSASAPNCVGLGSILDIKIRMTVTAFSSCASQSTALLLLASAGKHEELQRH